MTLEAIRYQRGRLDILDQLLLPSQTVFISINDTKDAWSAIKKMQVNIVTETLRLELQIPNNEPLNSCLSFNRPHSTRFGNVCVWGAYFKEHY